MTNAEIVKKIVGQIRPVGNSEIDRERFENLCAMCEMVHLLVYEIDRVAYENKDRHESSMQKAGQHAQKFIETITKEFQSLNQ